MRSSRTLGRLVGSFYSITVTKALNLALSYMFCYSANAQFSGARTISCMLVKGIRPQLA